MVAPLVYIFKISISKDLHNYHGRLPIINLFTVNYNLLFLHALFSLGVLIIFLNEKDHTPISAFPNLVETEAQYILQLSSWGRPNSFIAINETCLSKPVSWIHNVTRENCVSDKTSYKGTSSVSICERLTLFLIHKPAK